MKRGDYVTGMRRQVGWFVIIGIGAVLLLLLVITVRTDVFAEKFDLYVSPVSASAFFIGQEVKFQGFTIGRVRNIALQPHGRVQVDLHLLERYHGMLHEGAIVRLIKEGFIGQQTVEITSGKVDAPVLQNQSLVPYQTEASVEQLLLDLKPAVDNADTLLNELVKLAKWLNDPNGDVRQATASLRQASEGVEKGTIKRTFTEVSKAAEEIQKLSHQLTEHKAAEQLATSLKQTALILKDIEPLTHKLGKQGPETLLRVNTLLGRVDKLTVSLTNISSDLENLTPELPGLAQESKDTIIEIQRLIRGLRGSWMFSDKQLPVRGEDEGVAPPGLDFRP